MAYSSSWMQRGMQAEDTAALDTQQSYNKVVPHHSECRSVYAACAEQPAKGGGTNMALLKKSVQTQQYAGVGRAPGNSRTQTCSHAKPPLPDQCSAIHHVLLSCPMLAPCILPVLAL